MYFHYAFFVIYLVNLAWSADKYHAALKKISSLRAILQNPKSNKEIVIADLDQAKLVLRSWKKKSFILLVLVFILHLTTALILSSFFSLYNLGLSSTHWIFPFLSLGISLVILLVIFWLKGKGGGIPSSKAMREFGGTNWGK